MTFVAGDNTWRVESLDGYQVNFVGKDAQDVAYAFFSKSCDYYWEAVKDG